MRVPAEMETVLDADLITADGRYWDYQVWLSWTACEPWAVTMTLPSASEPVQWRFALDLLHAGLDGPAGMGDVQLFPVRAPGAVEMEQVEVRFGLDADHSVHVYLDREPLTEFLDEIEVHHGVACEAVREQLDDELAWLINDPDSLGREGC